MKKTKTQKLTLLTMLLAMSIVLHMIEPSLPIPIPGVKLGLANILGVMAYWMFGAKEMITINLMRVLLASLMRGILFGTSFWISLTGVVLSTVIVIIIGKRLRLSVIVLSVIGSILHGIGQILAVCFIYNTMVMAYYLPFILMFSIPAGVLTGYLAAQALKRIQK